MSANNPIRAIMNYLIFIILILDCEDNSYYFLQIILSIELLLIFYQINTVPKRVALKIISFVSE